MATLYELSERYQNILEVAEMLDPEQLEEALKGIDDEIENKADGYAKVIQELNGKVDVLKKEEKRLADRRKSIENNAKRIKESLQEQMLLLDKRKFKTDLFSFGIQKNAPSLDVIDYQYIPKEFYEEQQPKLNKRELLKAMKNGDVIKGVEVKQTESLRIR